MSESVASLDFTSGGVVMNFGVLTLLGAIGIPLIFLTPRGEKSDRRAGMNLGADDYLAKPIDANELLEAIRARLERHQEKAAAAMAQAEFTPDFSSAQPLESLGLTPREAEVLLWIAQGKSNPDIGTILGAAEGTVRKHVEHIFEKLGLEARNAATLRALEVLSSPARPSSRAAR